jgi:hypothetical protein
MTANYWLLAAPLAGSAVNVMAQLILARVLSGERLLLVVVIAFCIGLAATCVITGFALTPIDSSVPDALALIASVLTIYSAAGFALFAIVNLGETSLRIRMMRVLLDSPHGVRRGELVANYDDRALISVRLQRLREKMQVRFLDGIYYSRPSFLFLTAAGVQMLKRVLYGRR